MSLNWKEIVPNKINEEMPLKFEIKDEPMADNSLSLTECVDNTGGTLFKSDGSEIVCEDSKTDISYCAKFGENMCNIGKDGNLSANRINQEIPLKFEIKEEPSYDNSLNLTEFVDVKVETFSKSDGSEIVCEDSKTDISCYAKFGENMCNIGKDGNLSANKINQKIPLKFKIKDEPLYDNSINLTECVDDTMETLSKRDDSEICSENSKIDSGHIWDNNVAECQHKSEEGTKHIIVNNEKFKKATEKKYHCEVCNKGFIKSVYLKKHMRIHNDGKPYQCDVCKKCFNRLGNLNIHKRTHTNEKPHQCDVCNKSFRDSNGLNNHKLTHTGEKPYQCEVCKKCFNRLSNLNVHKVTHTDAKSYQCDVCNKSFRYSNSLNNHKRAHTGEKPYLCDICKKCFRQLGYLIIHKRTHTDEKPYQCDVCIKSFKYSTSLKNHKRTHTGEKPYQCDVCNRCFSLLGSLKIHKLSHTDKKPYQCDACD